MSVIYGCHIQFPMRCLNQEVKQIIINHYGNHIKAGQEWKDILQNQGSGSDKLAYLEYDVRNGRFEHLESYFMKNRIPFDAYCSEDGGHPPEHIYWRPEWEESGIDRPKVVKLNYDGDEFVTVDFIMGNIHLSDSEFKEAMKSEVDKFTSHYVRSLDDYATETDLGQNTDMMEKINNVLNMLDCGDIDDTTAMAMIKKIREDENK